MNAEPINSDNIPFDEIERMAMRHALSAFRRGADAQVRHWIDRATAAIDTTCIGNGRVLRHSASCEPNLEHWIYLTPDLAETILAALEAMPWDTRDAYNQLAEAEHGVAVAAVPNIRRKLNLFVGEPQQAHA